MSDFKRVGDVFSGYLLDRYLTIGSVDASGVTLYESDRRGQPMGTNVEFHVNGDIEDFLMFVDGPTTDAIRKQARSKR